MFLSSLLFPSVRFYCWEQLQYCLHFHLPTMVRKVSLSTEQRFLHFSLYCILFWTAVFSCVCISTAHKINSIQYSVYIITRIFAELLSCTHTIKMPFCPCSYNTAHWAAHNIECLQLDLLSWPHANTNVKDAAYLPVVLRVVAWVFVSCESLPVDCSFPQVLIFINLLLQNSQTFHAD